VPINNRLDPSLSLSKTKIITLLTNPQPSKKNLIKFGKSNQLISKKPKNTIFSYIIFIA
jgi:hypothetical protein